MCMYFIYEFTYIGPKMSQHSFLENECILFYYYIERERNVFHPTFFIVILITRAIEIEVALKLYKMMM